MIEGKYMLNSLNKDVRAKFEAFLAEVESKGFNIIITSGYRGLTEQSVLFMRNKANAKPGLSAHNYGYAIDINVSRAGNHYKKATPIQEWKLTGIPLLASKHGLRWGGDLKGYNDPIHFDATRAGDTARWLAWLEKEHGHRYMEIKANEISWKGI
jgi:hypothetical protein